MVLVRWLKAVVVLTFLAQSLLSLSMSCDHAYESVMGSYKKPVTEHVHHPLHDVHNQSHHASDEPPLESLAHCCLSGVLCLMPGCILLAWQGALSFQATSYASLHHVPSASFVPDEPISSLYRPPISRSV